MNVLLYGQQFGVVTILSSQSPKRYIRLEKCRELLNIIETDEFIINKVSYRNIQISEKKIRKRFGEPISDLEQQCMDMLTSKGYYDVQVIKGREEPVNVIIAYKEDSGYAVLCVHSSELVGRDVVKQIIANKPADGDYIGVILTDYRFTKMAKKLAEEKNVILWDNKVFSASE